MRVGASGKGILFAPPRSPSMARIVPKHTCYGIQASHRRRFTQQTGRSTNKPSRLPLGSSSSRPGNDHTISRQLGWDQSRGQQMKGPLQIRAPTSPDPCCNVSFVDSQGFFDTTPDSTDVCLGRPILSCRFLTHLGTWIIIYDLVTKLKGS